MAAYPPLAYGAIGVISAVSPIPIEIAYRIVMVLALAGVGSSVVLLGRQLGLNRWTAGAAGGITLLMHPVLTGVGLWGSQATLVALPFAISSVTMLERAVQHGRPRPAVIAGVLMGVSLLAHHMTAFAFTLGLVGWGVARLAPRGADRMRVLRALALAGGTGLAVSGVWIAFFLAHVLGVGFEREIPGNWGVAVGDALRASVSRSFIAAQTYPSYLGIVQVPLAIGGVAYAFFSAPRFAPLAAMLVVFTWFGLGDGVMPLIRVYPFSGLDVARFGLFMAPFMSLLGVVFLEAMARDALRVPRFALRPDAVRGALAAGALLLAVMPVADAVSARSVMEPVNADPVVDEAMAWLVENAGEGDSVLGLGFGTWGAWAIPERTGLPIMDGWNDEGADAWREIRDIRLLSWFPYFGQADDVYAARLHEVMDSRDTRYVVILQWAPEDSPQLWEPAVQARHDLFLLQAVWPGLTIYERLE